MRGILCKKYMEHKSHFLAHFIPGMLLGAVVGLAFGSLWVASLIPEPVKTTVQTILPGNSPAETRFQDGPLLFTLADDSQVSISYSQAQFMGWLNNYHNAKMVLGAQPYNQTETPAERVSEGLISAAEECNPNLTAEEKERLQAAADAYVQVALTAPNTSYYEYTVASTDLTQEPHGYQLIVVPNVTNIPDYDTFRAMFDICAAGGTYPIEMSPDWLVFQTSCGSGYSDGSGLPNGCDEARKGITLEIKK